MVKIRSYIESTSKMRAGHFQRFLREMPPRQGYNPGPEEPANRKDTACGFYDESDDHRPDREPIR